MSKQHPILFSTEMVQAILDGRKTQTRRVVKPQHLRGNLGPDGSMSDEIIRLCPYGKPGDILWVRETWARDVYTRDYVYKASADVFYSGIPAWKPSIHMPKDACRLILRITNVRVERLHEISDTDVMNEGAQDSWFTLSELTGKTNLGWMRPGFERLWSKINGAESWNANPWVWVVEFERVSREEVAP